MNEKADEQLDRLLQKWADEHAADGEQLEVLRQKVMSHLESGGEQPDIELASPASIGTKGAGSHKGWRRVAMISMTSAALLIVALVVVSSYRRNGTEQKSDSISKGDDEKSKLPPEFTWLTKDQIDGKRSLLSEMDRVFSDRLTWVAESDGQVQVGLVESEHPSNLSAKSLAIRLVVVRKTRENPIGTPVWAVDLVTRNEQLVQVTPNSRGNANLSLWAFVMPDGNIAIETDLNLHGSHAMHPTASTVQQPGQPSIVYSHRGDDAEYVVYQTVSVL
jgi:hypothetical protein